MIAFGFALVFEVPATRAKKLLVDAILGKNMKHKDSMVKNTDTRKSTKKNLLQWLT